MTHETASGWPIAGIKSELAAAGLVGGVVPGNVQAVQEVTEGLGHLGGELIDITGDKELNGHGQIVAISLGLYVKDNKNQDIIELPSRGKRKIKQKNIGI
jgi:hypothetical protein